MHEQGQRMTRVLPAHNRGRKVELGRGLVPYLAGNQDAIAVVSFAILGLLVSLLLATAFSMPAQVAEALLTMS
jgi:hypothetical protein